MTLLILKKIEKEKLKLEQEVLPGDLYNTWESTEFTYLIILWGSPFSIKEMQFVLTIPDGTFSNSCLQVLGTKLNPQHKDDINELLKCSLNKDWQAGSEMHINTLSYTASIYHHWLLAGGSFFPNYKTRKQACRQSAPWSLQLLTRKKQHQN